MNSNEMTFLRFLNRVQYGMSITDGLAILDEAKRLFPAEVEHRTDEGTMWRGILFTPAAEDAMRRGRKIEAIKHVRDANRGGWSSGYRYNSNEVTGKLALKDTKEIVEARMEYMAWSAN